jgi:hypothetical protein
MVEWPCRNPNWCCGIHLSGLKSSFILLSISFSKTLDSTDIRLMGRYEVTSVGSFPGLAIVIIC